jgi:hypothetical protein
MSSFQNFHILKANRKVKYEMSTFQPLVNVCYKFRYKAISLAGISTTCTPHPLHSE